MKGAYAALVLMVGALAVVALIGLRALDGNGSAAASDGGRAFRAVLSGNEEVPPVAPTDTSGTFKIKFNKDRTKAEFELTVRDGLRVRQAHIHCGAIGVNGDIVVFLAGRHDPGWDVDGKWIDNTTVTDANIVDTDCGVTLADLAESMEAGNTYVNVHTAAHPGGEVRGQVKAAGGDED